MAFSIPPRVQRLAGVALRQARMLDPTPEQIALYQKRLSQLTPDEVRYLQTLRPGRTTDVSNPEAVLFALEKANPIYKTDEFGESIWGPKLAEGRGEARYHAQSEGFPRPVINAPLNEQLVSYKTLKNPDDFFRIWAEKNGMQRAGWEPKAQQPSAQINNSIRQSQGLNTGATQNLNLTSREVVVNGRSLTPEEIVANYNKSIAIRPKSNLSAVDRYLGIEGRDYSGQDSATAFNDFMKAAAEAPRPVQQVVSELPKRIDGAGYPEVKTYWGTVNGRTAPYPGSVLSKQKESYDSPTYPYPAQLWAEATDPGRMHQVPSSITTKTGKIIPAPGRIVLDRVPVQFPDGYQITLGTEPRKQYLTLDQSLAHLEASQKAGMAHATGKAVSNNPDAGPTTETWDVKLGGLDLAQGAGWVVRPQNQNQALGEVFNSQPVQMVTSDIERGVRGISDYRLMPAANRRVLSDALPSTPQWAADPARYQAAARFLNEEGASGADIIRQMLPHEQTRNIVPLPIPTREQAIKAAQLNDNAAWLNYKAEQAELLKQRNGSFNIVVNNDGTYQRAIDEGIMPGIPNPDNPEQDIIPNLYLGNEPYRVKVNADGRIALPDLDRMNVHIPGVGRFPMTGGATLDVELARKYPDNPDDQSRFTLKNLVRNRSNPFMMDALDALKTKQKQYERATAQYLSAKESPTVSQAEVEALEKIAVSHHQQYREGLNAYNTATQLEPQPSVQNINLQIESPKDIRGWIEELRGYGLNVDKYFPGGISKITASGNIPINKLHKLNSFLASKFNREELILPRDVSIASEMDVFKKAGIAPNTLLKGVEWGTDDKGRQIVTNTGTPIGITWEGQRVRVDPLAQQPEVRQIPTYGKEVYQRDPEIDELIEAREAAKQQRVNKLIEVVNIRKAQRGEPLLGINDAGEVYTLANNSIQVLQNPEVIGSTVFSAAAQRRDAFNQGTTDTFNQLLAQEEAKHPAIAQAIANNPETYNQPVGSFGALQPYNSSGSDPESRYSQGNTMKSKQRLGYSKSKSSAPDFVNSSLANTNGLEEDAFTRKMRRESEAALASIGAEAQIAEAVARHQQIMAARNTPPVIAPATVNLNHRPATLNWVQQMPEEAMPHVDALAYGRNHLVTTRPVTLDWVQQVPEQPLPQIDVVEMYRNRLGTPQVHTTQAPIPQRPDAIPVFEEQAIAPPINTPQERGWNHYHTAAAALGALGLGTGVGYVMAPKGRSEEEKTLRQQMLQEQYYLQQLQQR